MCQATVFVNEKAARDVVGLEVVACTAKVVKGDREMNDVNKLRTLLPNWVEHNAEHAAEVRKWAERVQQVGEDSAAQGIVFAANALETANDALQVALKQLGGPLE
jgi:hypothetical protein